VEYEELTLIQLQSERINVAGKPSGPGTSSKYDLTVSESDFELF